MDGMGNGRYETWPISLPAVVCRWAEVLGILGSPMEASVPKFEVWDETSKSTFSSA